MHYLALATDYDGTIAADGVVDAPTIAALERLKAGRRKLILVTGRELDDLVRVMPRLDLFDRVVAENGALLYRPDTREARPLADRPPPRFIERLRAEGVQPLSVGRVIVATWVPQDEPVLRAIRDLGLGLQITYNKGAVMVLPAGVHKGTGLLASLDDLGLSPIDCVGVGDAENDHAFLGLCGMSVAVANALPAVKETAGFVTRGARGAGVAELIDVLLASDLRELDFKAPQQRVPLAQAPSGTEDEPLTVVPRREALLLSGISGGGKSAVTLGLLERLHAAGFQSLVVDPEGDYEDDAPGVRTGTGKTPPDLAEVLGLLSKPGQSVIADLLAIPLADRPAYFASLLAETMTLRAASGRPHVVIVDEAHHMLPADWQPGDAMPLNLDGFLLVTVHPDRLSPRAVARVDRIMVVGDRPQDAALAFCRARDLRCDIGPVSLRAGEMLTLGADDPRPRVVRVIPHEGARTRHRRKYAEGQLGEDKSFYFRGPDAKLNLRAQNLIMFLQMSDGVDRDTWQFHRNQGDYSRWIAEAIKDDVLARAVGCIEAGAAEPDEARRQIRGEIEQRYTLPV